MADTKTNETRNREVNSLYNASFLISNKSQFSKQCKNYWSKFGILALILAL